MSVPTSTYSLSHAVSSFTPGYTPTSSPNPNPSSPPPEPLYDILIYGSTSFTGKLVITYLVTHPQSKSFTYALAGRTQGKLDDLANKVEQEGYERPSILYFPLEEGEEGEQVVKDAVGKCRVVVNLAGPFSTQNAEMLIRQCAKQGRHYVDLTGETPWVKEMIEKYDFLASRTGSCIVPCCGYDSIPSDLTTYLSAQALARSPQSTSSNSISNSKSNPSSASQASAEMTSSETFHWARGGVSGGTVGSAFVVAEMDRRRLGRGGGEFALCLRESGTPSKGLRPVYYNALSGLRGMFFVMAPCNSAIVRRSWSILQRAPLLLGSGSSEHTDNNTGDDGKTSSTSLPARYGRDFTYDEALCLSPRGRGMSALSSWFFGLVLTAFGAAFASSSIVRSLVRLVAPVSGSGPSDEQQKNGWFEAVNVAQSETDAVVTTMFGKYDPGYSGTARMLAESALSLSIAHAQISRIGKLGGVLTPSTAMGDILTERLRRFGNFEITTTSFEEWKHAAEGKKDV